VEDPTTLLARVAQRAAVEPEAVLPALRVLAGDAPYDSDAPQRVDPARKSVVVEINRARVAADRAEFVAACWTAEQVATHLGVASRQAVAQRRARGGLLGARIGTRTYYPAWQFDDDGLARGLDRLLALVHDSGVDDVREIDAVLRMKHSALRGRTLLEVWRRGDWTTLEIWLGDIAGWRR
jgi:hypothetical protein